jgi:sensor histidine kinase YesM
MMSKSAKYSRSGLQAVAKYLQSIRSMKSGNLRRAISTNALNLEQRRQELELENLELELQQKRADLKKKEEDIRLQQLQNEKLELDLMERRIRIQEAQQHELSSL